LSEDDKTKDGADKKIVGAREKLRKARRYDSGFFTDRSQEVRNTIPLIVIYALSIGFAAVLTEGILKKGIPIGIDHSTFDQMLFGPGEPPFTGLEHRDKAITIFVRGTAIFLVTGILPLFAKIWQTLLDRASMSTYVAFWGTSVCTGLGYYLIRDYVAPAVKFVVEMFM